MKILRSCVIAFSMYSKIPVPQFDWKEEDMKYVFCFFPCIGAVIGLLISGWGWICRNFHIGSLAYVLMGTAIPILVTGGFHVDGYMDTMDALHSYQDRERKLEILKDSHIGAFSVIMLLLYYLIYLAAFSEVIVGKDLAVVSLGFVLSRIMSGLGAVCLRPAKKDGLLRAFSKRAAQKNVAFVLFLEMLVCAAAMLLLSPAAGVAALIGAGGTFLFYRIRSYHEFGGVTGDTAGYFLLLCEAAIVIGAAIGSHLF